ncbi:hypothetical protein J7K41_04470, partial [Candidatus Micrarchaeota archaeon]|nr:hypothetical protein [Candidatus Micrarchaeota archaeon]
MSCRTMKSQEIPSLSKLKKIKLDDLDDEIKERLYSYCETLDDRLYPESTKMIKGKYKTLYVFGKMVKRMEPKSEHRKKGELLIFMAVERTTKQKTKDEEKKTEIRETKKEKRGGAKTEFLKYKEEGETKIDRIVREEIEIYRLRKRIKSLKKRFNRDEIKLINKLVSELSEKLDFNISQEL